jgi:PTH1 family peptidyl-tRNA hydrolase
MDEPSPWLVVGLGNPGPRYARTRHNVGFLVVDAWVEQAQPGATWREKWRGEWVGVTGPFGRAIVLKPQGFMNRSGESVGGASAFHHVPPERVVIAHDEVDFEFGRIAVKRGGGHGGHNGLRDVIARLGSADFARIRVGIGRPMHGEVSDWVLSPFSTSDAAELPDLVDRAREALSCVLTEGVDAAMNRFNRLPT